MKTPKPGPKIEYIEVSEKDQQDKLAVAFHLLFEEVLKSRSQKGSTKTKIPSIDMEVVNSPLRASMDN